METMDTYGHLFESNSTSLAEKMDAAAREARSKKKNDMVIVSRGHRGMLDGYVRS